MTVATTLVSTSLIAYRLHEYRKQALSNHTKSRFKHIFEVLVQSSAAYSLAAIAFATVSIIHTETSVPVLVARYYAAAFYLFTAGAAPTVMVYRVLFTKDVKKNDPSIPTISTVRFRRPITRPNSVQFEGGNASSL